MRLTFAAPGRKCRGSGEPMWPIHPTESSAWDWTEDDCVDKLSPNCDVARFDCLSTTRMSKAADRATATVFDRGTATSRVRDHLRTAMSWATVAVVVDPYAGKEEVERPASSGLAQFAEWLARELAIIGRPLQELSIYTAAGVRRQMGSATSSIVSGGDILTAPQSVRARISTSDVSDSAASGRHRGVSA